MSRRLRIAYLGPAPRARGGVPEVAALLLPELLRTGHEVDCYVAGLEEPLPGSLREHPGFEAFDGRCRFRYDQWYSRTELTKLISGQTMRALTERRLAQGLRSRHAERPYDVVYQFSHVEVFNLGTPRTPPLVVHPETHTAGELEWFKRESALARRCEPLHRRLAARTILDGRTAMQRRHVRLAAGFVCPSRAFQRSFCADYAVDPGSTRVVPNPIDLGKFKPARRPRRPHAPIRLLFIGRISVRKGVETVVELSHLLSDLHGSISLELYGDRTQWSDYRRLLSDLNPGIARYGGSVQHDQIPALMANADVLIQPSKYEPFGLTVAEALASGVPVVATDEVGAAEDVSRECARIVPVGDVRALAAEVRLLVRRIAEGAGTRLSDLARREAERLFDPRHVGEALGAALEELAGPVGASRSSPTDG